MLAYIVMRVVLLAGILALGVFLAILSAGIFPYQWGDSGRVGGEESAGDILDDSKALRAYLKEFGVRKTMQRLSTLATVEESCHWVAHDAGEIGLELYSDSVFRECSDDCQSGCYHGAIAAYFKERGTADFSTNLRRVCSDELNDFVRLQCFHGIGHGLLAWANYDLPEALRGCDLLPKNRSSCWVGVFMENAAAASPAEAAGEPERHVSEYLSDDPLYPCTAVGEKYRSTCYFMQTTRMARMFSDDLSRVVGACLTAPTEYRRSCFESMGRDVGTMPLGDPRGAIEKCGFAPQGVYRTACLVGVAEDVFWDPSGQDAALEFCGALSEESEKLTCYRRIAIRASRIFSQDSKYLASFCAKFHPEYALLCVERMRPL